MPEALDELYRDIIMEHYRYPRGRTKIAQPDVINEGKNPLCGDEIEVAIKIDDGRIEDIEVDCVGCAISVASGSMLADVIKGKKLEEVKTIAAAIKAILRGEEPPMGIELGDLEALAGVSRFPARIKCALLSWATLIDGIESLERGTVVRASSIE
jgi:nitrogen fixation NifU-like protein